MREVVGYSMRTKCQIPTIEHFDTNCKLQPYNLKVFRKTEQKTHEKCNKVESVCSFSMI